ncbi:MAG TPA: hypothetical protein DCP51_08410 [Clostridiales bacterium]|nr:hypothetical protein [Clostridiales bacterium]
MSYSTLYLSDYYPRIVALHSLSLLAYIYYYNNRKIKGMSSVEYRTHTSMLV